MPKMFSLSTMFLKLFFFAHENMKKPASKVAKPAQIQAKSQFLFHKNLPSRDFSLMTLADSWSRRSKSLISSQIVSLHQTCLEVIVFFASWTAKMILELSVPFSKKVQIVYRLFLVNCYLWMKKQMSRIFGYKR